MTGLEDLRRLRAFVCISESGSLSGAARVLNTTQPTLSRQLGQLERELRVTLVRRDTHAMRLTAAGERLLREARDLVDRAEAARRRLHQERDQIRGHLRIVAVLDLGQFVVSRLIAQFRQRHPEVTAELHLINRPGRFLEEGYDCGILVGRMTDRSVAARKVAEIRRLLVASPALVRKVGPPGAPADLKRFPWMGVLQPHFYARDGVTLLRGRDQRVVKFAPVLLLDGVTALREASMAGAGVTPLPEWLVGDALARGQLVHLLPDWSIPPVDVHVAFPAGRYQPERLRAFVEFASTQISKLIEERVHPTLLAGRTKTIR